MTARRISAVLGAAFAAAAVVFTSSLVATNDRQAVSVAERLLAAIPVKAGARTVSLAADYRPGGRVMQGPPLMAVIAEDDGVEGAKVAKSFFAARRLDPPPVGETLVLVGRKGAYKVRITGFIDWDRPARGYPNMIVSPAVAAGIGEEWRPFEGADAKTLARAFTSDAARNFDMSKTLLLWAAFLTALALVVNSLFLSIEAKRREIALLRVAGMTRASVARKVFFEAAAIAFSGAVLGLALGVAALFAYVACDKAMFPEGAAVSWPAAASAVLSSIPVAAIAGAIALRKALSVRPLEAASAREPRSGHAGMIVAFAFGFGAFVAVEVWGASLMKSFVPSKTWPDAIVSILPGGVSSFDIGKLKNVGGVKRISELQPLQVNISPLEELKEQRGGRGLGAPRMKQYRNALLLASEWMPDFDGPGSGERLSAALREDDTCVITKMMARARGLETGGFLELDCGRGLLMKLKIVGTVDLNWHMVTSRGLLRGLGRMPANTDGPVFTSFDTLAAADARPQDFVTMTHLWLDFEPGFLASNGVFGAGRKVERGITEALGGAWLKTKAGDVRGNTVRLHSRDEISDGTLAHGSDLIGSMARVPFIFIVVISLGFVAMVAASADARRKEFETLRAVGATRWQIAGILAGEALRVALKGILYGTAAGSAAGWLFTFATRSAMSNWGIPPAFAFPLSTIAVGGAISIFSALAVAVPAAASSVRVSAKPSR